MVVRRVAEVVSPDVARRAIARSDTAHEFVSRRRVVAGDEDGTTTVNGRREPVPFGLSVLVETNIGRVIAVADECAWDYRDLHFAEGPRGRYCEPSPPRDPQRAHIRRWLAGEVSEDDSEDY